MRNGKVEESFKRDIFKIERERGGGGGGESFERERGGREC